MRFGSLIKAGGSSSKATMYDSSDIDDNCGMSLSQLGGFSSQHLLTESHLLMGESGFVSVYVVTIFNSSIICSHHYPQCSRKLQRPYRTFGQTV